MTFTEREVTHKNQVVYNNLTNAHTATVKLHLLINILKIKKLIMNGMELIQNFWPAKYKKTLRERIAVFFS